MRPRWLLLFSLLVCVLGLVLGFSLGKHAVNTKFAKTATVTSFLAQGNALCTPLVRLENPSQFSERQLLVARTEIEELAQLKVPASLLKRWNVVLGDLATYGQDYAKALTENTGPSQKVRTDEHAANTALHQVGLTSCSV